MFGCHGIRLTTPPLTISDQEVGLLLEGIEATLHDLEQELVAEGLRRARSGVTDADASAWRLRRYRLRSPASMRTLNQFSLGGSGHE
jgi:hypothetical protein